MGILLVSNLRAEGIGRPTAAKQDSPVWRFGQIYDCVARGSNTLSVLPSDLRPLAGAQWLRKRDQRIDGQQRSVQAWEARQIRLSREHHCALCAQFSAGRD